MAGISAYCARLSAAVSRGLVSSILVSAVSRSCWLFVVSLPRSLGLVLSMLCLWPQSRALHVSCVSPPLPLSRHEPRTLSRLYGSELEAADIPIACNLANIFISLVLNVVPGSAISPGDLSSVGPPLRQRSHSCWSGSLSPSMSCYPAVL